MYVSPRFQRFVRRDPDKLNHRYQPFNGPSRYCQGEGESYLTFWFHVQIGGVDAYIHSLLLSETDPAPVPKAEPQQQQQQQQQQELPVDPTPVITIRPLRQKSGVKLLPAP